MLSSYPERAADRDRWILDQRPVRSALDWHEPYSYFVEDECGAEGKPAPVATIFLTNRECPFRCVMCDLWKNTLHESVPLGAIPGQIDFALSRLPRARLIKLYNSGSFFDPRAIPIEDYAEIAARVSTFERIIVECHPAFIGSRCIEFRNLIAGQLEIAIGLETAHPETLEKLNKRMTLQQFARAAEFMRMNKIDLRVFILVQPPFMEPEDALHWAKRSLDFAFDCGAGVATLIPTRAGNGAMEALAAAGAFRCPRLSALETALNYGVNLNRGRVFADLWDLKVDAECRRCFEARIARLRHMNLSQRMAPRVQCDDCGGQP